MTEIHPAIAQVLTNHAVSNTLHRHADFPAPIQSPTDFADALGYTPARIAKTLFVQAGNEATFALIVCPALAPVNFKQIAGALGWKKATFGKAETLAQVVGYPRLGVSPLGVSTLPVLFDSALLVHPTILIAAGAIGVEIEIAPQDVVLLTHATVLSLTATDSHSTT
jgi:Cys-tRNA(Pro)/Cys-tRNA(Cys) deacylase